ncbi:hypothetical protein [Chromobacterium phragmitis]|uniref:Uncharacterized protein n=1 Tax=Chromobacterium phragmitis TaxID=2202141 RepID=A0ABV0IP00_9NEIS
MKGFSSGFMDRAGIFIARHQNHFQKMVTTHTFRAMKCENRLQADRAGGGSSEAPGLIPFSR